MIIYILDHELGKLVYLYQPNQPFFEKSGYAEWLHFVAILGLIYKFLTAADLDRLG